MNVLTPILLLLFAASALADIKFSSKALAFGRLLTTESKTLSLELKNPTDNPIRGQIVLDNPGLGSNERFGKYTKKNKEASLVSWLTLSEKNITIEANASQTIELTINTPEVTSGDYRAWLFFSIDKEESLLKWPYPKDRIAITAQINQPNEAITLDSIQNALEIRGPKVTTLNDISPALKIDVRLINNSPVNIETHGQCTLLTKEGQPIMSAPLLLTHTGAYEKTWSSCLFSHYLPKDQYLLDIDLHHKVPFINAGFKTSKRVAAYIRTKDERLLMDADARLLIPDVAIQSSFSEQTKETAINIQSLYEQPITLKLLSKDKNGLGNPSIINQPLSPRENHSLSINNDSSLVISIKEDRKRMPLELTPKLANNTKSSLSENAIQFAPQISIKEWNNNAHIFAIINYLPTQEINTATLTLQIINKQNKGAILKTGVPVVLPSHGHSPLHLVIPALDAGDYQVNLSIAKESGIIATQRYDLQVSFSSQFKVYHAKSNRYISKFIMSPE